jgi:hypothetical protein
MEFLAYSNKQFNIIVEWSINNWVAWNHSPAWGSNVMHSGTALQKIDVTIGPKTTMEPWATASCITFRWKHVALSLCFILKLKNGDISGTDEELDDALQEVDRDWQALQSQQQGRTYYPDQSATNAVWVKHDICIPHGRHALVFEVQRTPLSKIVTCFYSSVRVRITHSAYNNNMMNHVTSGKSIIMLCQV